MNNNRDVEEKLEAYRNMLISGQIDEATFNNMVRRNLGENIDVYKARRPRKSIVPLIVVLLACLIVFGINKLLKADDNAPVVEKEYEKISSYKIIDPPIQNDFKGSTSIVVGNVSVRVDYVAYYEVSGKVVAKVSYMPDSVSNMAAQSDVALVWGKLATDEYLKKFTFNAPGNRFVYWKTTDMNWYRMHTSDREVKQMYSNNHLVTTNQELISKIKKIKKNDYVRIKGYLANLYWIENNSNRNWISSTRRDDDGDGACEVIYVTDIKWLEEGQ